MSLCSRRLGVSQKREGHRRRSRRLAGYDYRWPEAYFVTICTNGHRCVLGQVVETTDRRGTPWRAPTSESSASPVRISTHIIRNPLLRADDRLGTPALYGRPTR